MTTVNDLKDQIGTTEPRPILYCKVCGAQYSANAGDYWDRPSDYVFECCDQPMLLVVRRTVFTEVAA